MVPCAGFVDVPGEVLDQVERDERVRHRDLDVLALTCGVPVQQRGEHAVGDGQGGHLVAEDGRQVHRLAQGAVGDVDEAGGGLHGLVVGGVTGPVGVAAETLGVCVDQARVARGDVVVRQAQAAEGVRAHVGDEHVRGVDQVQGLSALGVVLEVERDAALVAVDVEVERGHAGRGAVLADADGVRGRLDLDHVGAEVSEDLGGVGAHHDGREVDHAHTVQGAGGGVGVRHRSSFRDLLRCLNTKLVAKGKKRNDHDANDGMTTAVIPFVDANYAGAQRRSRGRHRRVLPGHRSPRRHAHGSRAARSPDAGGNP